MLFCGEKGHSRGLEELRQNFELLDFQFNFELFSAAIFETMVHLVENKIPNK